MQKNGAVRPKYVLCIFGVQRFACSERKLFASYSFEKGFDLRFLREHRVARIKNDKQGAIRSTKPREHFLNLSAYAAAVNSS
ncbi:hypothetical protein [Mesorhizobium sp.]|uniref:hypothetical protein n=1 Tax=Mesorhizobium sp. TaxID=1871066 RepID=UPI000FE72DF6|nr:hypothetical protein [Mesorhizobium sp.]RWQ57833.1 MAG: hypothetical protein EOS84_04665 [Mesorhizobium sp.]